MRRRFSLERTAETLLDRAFPLSRIESAIERDRENMLGKLEKLEVIKEGGILSRPFVFLKHNPGSEEEYEPPLTKAVCQQNLELCDVRDRAKRLLEEKHGPTVSLRQSDLGNVLQTLLPGKSEQELYDHAYWMADVAVVHRYIENISRHERVCKAFELLGDAVYEMRIPPIQFIEHYIAGTVTALLLNTMEEQNGSLLRLYPN